MLFERLEIYSSVECFFQVRDDASAVVVMMRATREDEIYDVYLRVCFYILSTLSFSLIYMETKQQQQNQGGREGGELSIVLGPS